MPNRISDSNETVAGCIPGWFSPLRDTLLNRRPYFVLPLGLANSDCRNPTEAIRAQVIAATQATNATDLFVVSHGWHRNLFAGIAAYDRLLGRFAALKARNRLSGADEARPIFVAVHWNSDPEEDGW